MLRRIHFFIAFIFCFSCFAKADSLFVFTPQNEPLRISGKMQYFLDDEHKFTYENVWNNPGFKNAEVEVPNFNISKSTVWGKIRITTTKPGTYYFKLDPGSYLDVRLYHKTQYGKWETEHVGVSKDVIGKRAIKISHSLFKMNFLPGDTISLLIRVQEYYPINVDLKIGELGDFMPAIHFSDIYNGVCYGMMLMMLLYNLFLYITNKSIAYLYYVMYVMFSMIFTALLSGYGYHLPNWFITFIGGIPILPPAGFGIFGMLFTLKLFKGSFSRRFEKMVYVFMSAAGFNAVLSMTPLVHLSEQLIQVLGLFLGIFSITAGFIALKKKHSSARYYLLGFGAYMISLFYLILSAQGIFPITSFTWCILLTGSSLESIFLSFALGDKFRLFQLEKEKAQRESLEKSLENERLVREQNVMLEQKVKERTLELQEQKEIVEEKNKEIVDSINYAKRIQYTLLAHENEFTKHLNEHFIVFKPKDIVSGDFYWATEYNNKFYLAVCDSTGHGVPGAFMSLLNISFLNEAINEHSIEMPNEVFNYVRKRLIDNVSQDDQKDGMDGILISFDRKNKHVHYAAANNPPLLVRNNVAVDMQYNKMPVGKGIKDDPFTHYEFIPEKGDVLYLFTDGYSDQFGGPKGKKYKYKRLIEKLVEISKNVLSTQKKEIESDFVNWKGNLEQVDDVLVIGIRF
jgi:serine phosphatase RsbU (regulator of sigma subunit)